MPGNTWDVAVVGVGTMGSMALWRLARRGVRVIGFERYGVGHDLGAAGGETRMFRVAYKEGSWYVPLLTEASRLWDELGGDGQRQVLRRCGALTIGDPEHPDVAGVLRSAAEFDLPHRVLSGAEARRAHPRHRLAEGDVVVHDPRGGLLDAPLAIATAVDRARELGADVRTQTPVTALREVDGRVEIRAGDRTYHAAHAVVALGPWTAGLLPELAGSFDVLRVILHWFRATDPALFAPDRFPVGLRRGGHAEDSLSFFPLATPDGTGVKINLHVPKTAEPDPERHRRAVDPAYSARVGAAVARLFDGLDPRPVRATAYLEGYTPDNHGLVGPLPGRERVTALAGFSGHGFKLAPLLGEIAAGLALGDAPGPWPLDRLAAGRPPRSRTPEERS
ncbi:N-methyl-L-tryptophan oxidase [Streptomyces mayteni]